MQLTGLKIKYVWDYGEKVSWDFSGLFNKLKKVCWGAGEGTVFGKEEKAHFSMVPHNE